jgi:hypothetical protein
MSGGAPPPDVTLTVELFGGPKVIARDQPST